MVRLKTVCQRGHLIIGPVPSEAQPIK